MINNAPEASAVPRGGGGVGEFPEERPYDVSCGQNQYVPLP